MPHSSLAIANEFLSRGRDGAFPLTHMHLQKLVYLAHGYSLGSGRGPLVEDRFEAWAFGPVIRKLYDALKAHGPKAIPHLIRWGDDTPFVYAGRPREDAHEQLNEFERELIDWISQRYARLHAFQLSELTHRQGSPWHQAYVEGENRPIRNAALESHYRMVLDGAQTA